MTNKQIMRLVKTYGGWIDGEHIRFPSPHKLAQFEKALDEARLTSAR